MKKTTVLALVLLAGGWPWHAPSESQAAGASGGTDPAQLGAIARFVELDPNVRDPALAFLVGLLKDDVLDTLRGEDILRNARRPGASSVIPVKLLERMGRGASQGGAERVVTLWLKRDSKVPAPYSLLGYHPGSVLVPRLVVLHEWRCGHVVISERGKGSFALEDCYLWAVEEGVISIDIDAVVDRVLGGAVDDMTVRSLALFMFNGVRYAMAMGYNKNGQGRSGALNLVKNELEFPSPWQLRSAGKLLRRKAEDLVRAARAREGGATVTPGGELGIPK